jgi:Na+/H+-dicarboxylate symporter
MFAAAFNPAFSARFFPGSAMALHNKILIALGAGVLAGFVANVLGIGWLQTFFASIEPIGTAWIRLITMIVVPLVVASLMVGTASLGDIRKLGRIGGKTLGYYMMTTAVAVTIASTRRPGTRCRPSSRDRRRPA